MPVLTRDAMHFLETVVTQMDRITYLDMLTLADRIRRQRHASRLGSRHLARAWAQVAR